MGRDARHHSLGRFLTAIHEELGLESDEKCHNSNSRRLPSRYSLTFALP